MTERIECSGFVTSIDYCGFFIESWLQPTGYEFTLLHIRFLSDAYTIIDEETVHVHVMNSETIDGPNTQSTAAFNLTCQSHNISGSWYALEGDQFGAIISAECIGYQKKQNLRCPLQIGVISTGCEDSSIFFDNFELLRTKVPLKSIARETTDQVAVKLNFQVHIGRLSDMILILVNIIAVMLSMGTNLFQVSAQLTRNIYIYTSFMELAPFFLQQ